jgi:hypothetical protein
MPHYRCYLLNTSDNIVSVDSLQADDDGLAMSLAGGLLREKYTNMAAIEVWEQKRCLGRIASDSATPSALDSLLKRNPYTTERR